MSAKVTGEWYVIKLALLSIALATVSASTAFAAPSIYPTDVTRNDPGKAFNSFVLFSGGDRKTHLIELNGSALAGQD